MQLAYIMAKEKERMLGWKKETGKTWLINALAISTMDCRLHFSKYDHLFTLFIVLSRYYELSHVQQLALGWWAGILIIRDY